MSVYSNQYAKSVVKYYITAIMSKIVMSSDKEKYALVACKLAFGFWGKKFEVFVSSHDICETI
jgi:hypothetical protein